MNEVTEVLREESSAPGNYGVPVGDLVAGIEQRVATVAAEAAVKIRWETGELATSEVPSRVANLAALVLANLISNAIEATERGGEVTVRVRRAADQIAFEVADAGHGISPALQAQLFRPLRSTKVGGGGIGLAISHQLARHAGGTLELVSTGEKGTVFRLSVPHANSSPSTA